MSDLASAEGDDAANRIVGRDANRYAIPRHYLDTKTAHAAAQLRQHLMPLVALHAVKPATMYGHNGSLNVDQIVLAQLAFPFHSKIVPHSDASFNPSHSRDLGLRH